MIVIFLFQEININKIKFIKNFRLTTAVMVLKIPSEIMQLQSFKPGNSYRI